MPDPLIALVEEAQIRAQTNLLKALQEETRAVEEYERALREFVTHATDAEILAFADWRVKQPS